MTSNAPTPVAVQTAIGHLLDAHFGNRPMVPLSETYGDFSLEHAYAIQDALRAEFDRRGRRSIGWKLGATSPAGQSAMGVMEPAAGFLPPHPFPSDAEVSASRFADLRVEAEVAFRIGTRLAGPGVTHEMARDAVQGAAAALELPDLIFTGKPRVADFVASSVVAKAIVLGDLTRPLSEFDVAREEVVFEHNGQIVGTYTSAEVMGNPLNAVVWLANHLATRGLALVPGDIIMSGAITKALRPAVGDTVRARFAHLGMVSFKVAP